MKLKAIILFCFAIACSSVMAGTTHTHPQKNSPAKQKLVKAFTWPGQCDITIVNNSYDPVNVYGVFDDGEGLGFSIYPSEPPHTISLFYYGYCHYDMYISIKTFGGYSIYSGYPSVDSVIEIWPYYFGQFKAKVHK